MKPIINSLRMRCPKCGEGKLYNSRYGFESSTFQMNEKCPSCKSDFKNEPGFYTGAMYVSYAINIILGVIAFILYYITFDKFLAGYFVVAYSAIILFTFPWVFRVSRSIWLSLFG